MMKYLQVILKSIVYSNLFIAIASALQTELFQMLIFEKTNIHLSLLVFFLTFITYNFHRLYLLKKSKIDTEKKQWLLIHFKKIVFLLSLAFVGVVFCLFQISLNVLYLLLPLGIVVLAYVVDFGAYFNTTKITKLKKVPFLKIFLISAVWSIATVLLSLSNNLAEVSFSIGLLFFVMQFLFVFMLTIPFDIRDIDLDKKNKIKTIPIYLGIGKSKNLMQVILLIHQLLVFLGYYFFSLNLVAFVIFSLINAFIYFFTKVKIEQKSEFYIGFVYDGIIILQAVLILIYM